MAISPLNNTYTPYDSGYRTSGYGSGKPGADEKRLSGLDGGTKASGADEKRLPGLDDGTKASGEECQTCKNRKYQDGSDEMVSFKSPQHISPESAASRVRAHEQEHVSNAYNKAAQGDGKVLQASVSIRLAVCPECGRSYVAGGTTQTQIKYYNEENPYQQDLKATDHDKYAGMNLDYAV